MSFSVKDIKKLVNISNNTETVLLHNIRQRLESWEKDYGLDLSPEYQRDHRWNERTQIKFVEFVLRGGKIPTIMFNSPAYNDFVKSDLPDTIELVDGKQRLTAILKFLDNELPVFGGHYRKDIEGIEIFIKSKYITICVNSLTTRNEIVTWYLEMNEGHVAHTEDELNKARSFLDK